MRTQLALIALICGLFAAPAAAQNSASGFKLPEGATEPATRPQGPVDDTGIVPVGPRVIRTEPEQRAATTTAPAPRQTPPAQPQAEPVAQPAVSPSPRPAAPRATAPAGQTAVITPPTETPGQQVPPPASPPADVPAAQDLPAPATPITTPPAAPVTEASPINTALPQWVLWLAGALALAALLLALIAFGRRRAELRPVPEIERPVVDHAGLPISTREAPQFTARFDVQGFTRSMMMVTVKFSLQIANRSGSAMRNVRIAADLVSARSQLPMEQQVATPATDLAHMAEIERIGPQQSRSIEGTLTLPLAQVEPFFQGKTPLFIPLARLRVDCEGAEPQLQTYIVGMGSALTVGKVQPIALNTAPGSLQGVMARAIN